MHDRKTAALTIRLDPELERRLAKAARHSGRTRSEFVRDALRRQLAVSAVATRDLCADVLETVLAAGAMVTIELIYFDGCPNVDTARANLRAALAAAGMNAVWREWDQYDPAAPDRVRRYGSPTVLVNGEDVTGQAAGDVALTCRTDGAPSLDSIRAALER